MLGLHAGTPCESMSRARQAPEWSRMPARIRSPEFPGGLPNLLPKNQAVVAKGNKLSRVAARLLKLCKEYEVPCSEENPMHSYLWSLHGRIGRKFDAHLLDQCAHGSSARKATRIDSFRVTFQRLAQRCEQKKKNGRVCSFTGRKHEILSGSKDGQWLTTKTAACPPALCALLQVATSRPL